MISKNEAHLTEEELALCAEALSADKYNELPASIRNHLRTCDSCANEVIQIQAILQTQEDEAEGPVPAPKKKVVSMPAYWLIGAAASVVLLIGLGFWIGPFGGQKGQHDNPLVLQDSNTHAAHPDSLKFAAGTGSSVTPGKGQNGRPDKEGAQAGEEQKSPEGKQKPAIKPKPELAYMPYPPMEQLVQRFRDSAYRGGNVEVTAPSLIRIGPGEPLNLTWDNPGQETLYLSFFDNKGKPINEMDPQPNNFQTDTFSHQTLYYWKLMNEDFDLLFCGKIIIK